MNLLRQVGEAAVAPITAACTEVHCPFLLVFLCELMQTIPVVVLPEMQRALKGPSGVDETIAAWLLKSPGGLCLTQSLIRAVLTRHGAADHRFQAVRAQTLAK